MITWLKQYVEMKLFTMLCSVHKHTVKQHADLTMARSQPFEHQQHSVMCTAVTCVKKAADEPGMGHAHTSVLMPAYLQAVSQQSDYAETRL